MTCRWTATACATLLLPMLLLSAEALARGPGALSAETLSACGLSPGEFNGSMHIQPLQWDRLNRPLCAIEILPERAPNPGEKWPVVVLLHGLKGAPADWLRFARIHRRIRAIEREGALPPTVFLLPAGHNGYWTNWADGDHPYRDLVFAYLRDAEKRIPQIARDPAKRAIVGVSMGGFGAVSIALQHPDEFGAAVGLSPTDLVIATEQQPQRKVYRRVFGTPIEEARVRAVNPRDLVETGHGKGTVFRLIVGTAEGAKFTRGTRLLNEAMLNRGLQVDLTEIPEGRHRWDSTWTRAVHEDWLRQLGYMFQSHHEAAPEHGNANPVHRVIHSWRTRLEAHRKNAERRPMLPE